MISSQRMKIQQEKVNQALKAVYKGITKDITSSKHIIICYICQTSFIPLTKKLWSIISRFDISESADRSVHNSILGYVSWFTNLLVGSPWLQQLCLLHDNNSFKYLITYILTTMQGWYKNHHIFLFKWCIQLTT